MEQKFEKPKTVGYTVYSKSGCPNCIKIKNILKKANAPFSVIDCDEYLIESKEEFLKFIEETAEKSVRVFPMVFFERKFIGGCQDAEYHHIKLNAFSDDVFI
jgi:glutaredoxin